jgi:hypothetical protein
MNYKYKIIKQIYRDEYGNILKTYYYIKERTTFFGIGYWKTITHEICGGGYCIDEKTLFSSVEEAEKFIKKKLCNRVGREGWEEAEVKRLNCK